MRCLVLIALWNNTILIYVLHYRIYSRVSQGFQGISWKVKYCEISGFSLKIHLHIIFNICQQANNINTSLSNLTLEVLHQWKFLGFKVRNILFSIRREFSLIQSNPVKISSFQYGLEDIVSHPMQSNGSKVIQFEFLAFNMERIVFHREGNDCNPRRIICSNSQTSCIRFIGNLWKQTNK